jgi:hypothetical protein
LRREKALSKFWNRRWSSKLVVADLQVGRCKLKQGMRSWPRKNTFT